MSLSKKNNLPTDIDDEDKYRKITLYYDEETGQCFVCAHDSLSENDVYDILASGLESMNDEPSKPDDKGYLN